MDNEEKDIHDVKEIAPVEKEIAPVEEVGIAGVDETRALGDLDPNMSV